MLVLSRKQGQAIVIKGEIMITVVQIRGNKVRIGINAPRHISVHRQEHYDRIRSHPPGTGVMPAPDSRRQMAQA
jgi:carbon storage regulator